MSLLQLQWTRMEKCISLWGLLSSKLSSYDIKICVLSRCRILVEYMNTQQLEFFFQVYQSTTCTCWTFQWLDHLTWTDTDWTCWLTADTRVWKHNHKFETDSLATVHRLCTAYKQYTEGCCCWCVNHGRWWQHAQEMLSMRFQETAQSESEQHWHSDSDIKGLFFICTSRLNMPWSGSGRYVLFFIISSEIITSWLAGWLAGWLVGWLAGRLAGCHITLHCFVM